MNIFNLDIIDNDEGGHRDLIFEIPKLINRQAFDTYYFASVNETCDSLQDIKDEVVKLLKDWNSRIIELCEGEIIHLPIDFSDQYTGCIRVEKSNCLKLSYGLSYTEAWSVNPTKPDKFYYSINDFEAENEKSLIISQKEFTESVNKVILKLKPNM